MAKNPSTAHVVITAEGKQAKQIMEQLINTAKDLNGQIDKLKKSGVAPEDPKLKELESQLKTTNSAINQNKNAFIDLKKIVGELSSTQLGRLEKALKECRKQMKALTADDPRSEERRVGKEC